ncbi:hypothetical protein [Glycomyces xiaoerkulensis]|uniref:hypothetical protein n=1 Tax=Glycomyces xiaoerkulensis TaxID=2038139 RepID=UPI000C266442|nr:hypothetical protein [Glycomyces xiaoerkulensis]
MTDEPTPGSIADRLRGHADADEIGGEIEAALGRLEALPDLAVTDHVAVFEGVQQRLSDILGNVDDA